MEQRLFILQRLSAVVLAPLVLVHLVVILFAVRSGLSAQAILARTQGNWGWIVFYSVFVVAVSLHVPVGLRNILVEWARMKRSVAGAIALAFGVAIFVMGMRAVIAVGGLAR